MTRALTVSLAALLVLLLLMGCASPQQAVEVRLVPVPTPVECLPVEEIPAEPPRVADSLTGDAAADLPVVAASALQLRAWGQEMHGALVACAE